MEMVPVLKGDLPQKKRVPELDDRKRLQPQRRLPQPRERLEGIRQGRDEGECVFIGKWVGVRWKEGGVYSAMICDDSINDKDQ